MADVNTLAVGDLAPPFSAERDGGESISSADYAGKMVVLYFYPKDDTPGCTKQGIEFSDLIEEFENTNTAVIGVSRDSVKKHDKFREKHGLKVALISDGDGSITESYGVWVEKSMYGKKFMGIERATYLINADGKIAQIWRKVKVAGHVADVLEAAKKLTRS